MFCSHFDLHKIDKGPKEIFNPEIQKELLVLEEQEVSQCDYEKGQTNEGTGEELVKSQNLKISW